MGGALSLFTRLLWTKKEIRILILGLDNAGKTTLLYRLKIGEVVTTIPTIGFNVESVTYKTLNFNVWDLGGQTSIRPYWRCYYANTAAVVFVIDSTDLERLETAAGELRAMLQEEELRDAALLVFANKQDQPGAKGAGEISEALKLAELKDRNWSIMACSAIDGRGVNEGMDWLVVSTSERCSGYVRANWGLANGWGVIAWCLKHLHGGVAYKGVRAMDCTLQRTRKVVDHVRISRLWDVILGLHKQDRPTW